MDGSQSLLLDGDSQFLAKPELEIYADDVKCSHGATVGELDAMQLFYAESRGLDPAGALYWPEEDALVVEEDHDAGRRSRHSASRRTDTERNVGCGRHPR